ncbi:MAG: DNA adenine methylase [bacterium]|nr:DNA adenine methylase [bacterium]
MKKAKPIIPYAGSKWRIADWIISYIPGHQVYVEPYFGSGAVFFNKVPARAEVINDLCDDVVNLFRVIRERADELVAAVEMTPWARAEYELSYIPVEEPIEKARRFIVRCRQAFGTKKIHRTGWRRIGPNFSTSDYHIYTPEWRKLPARIYEVVDRLKDAQIESLPALEVIERFRGPEVLLYLDPPYPLDTRGNKKMYAFEMTDADHVELLSLLDLHPGPAMISGYRCDLYDDMLSGWQRVSRGAVAQCGKRRVESLWLNQSCVERLGSFLNFQEGA